MGQKRNSISRRTFLQASAASSAAAGLTLWLPRYARGEGRGDLRHVILVYLSGGVRWRATFAAADNVKQNPFGRLPWDIVPEGQKAHERTTGSPWPVSRIFHLRPVSQRQFTFDQAYARLSSRDPADYNFSQVPLTRWPGRPFLPSFCSMAHEISVVSADAAPGGPALVDHAAGQHNLFTGSTYGSVGLATLFNAGLKGRTRLPAVAVASPGFALGAGRYAQSRPLTLSSAVSLPTSYPGKDMADWAREYEGLLDGGHADRHPSFVAEAMRNFALEKAQGDTYISTLLENSLKISTAPLETAFGQTTKGEPVTNGMLREVFGVSSTDVGADDIVGDAYRSVDQPAWQNDPFGLGGALSVRLLQFGTASVCFTVGAFDTHAGELLYPGRSLSSQSIQLARLLSGLRFALQNIKDPDSGGALWDTTVVVAASEFGRQGAGIQPNGFNTGRGSDHDREQYFPIMGGPLLRKGQLLSDSGGKPFHMNSIWTSILEGMDVRSDYLRADKFAPIPGLLGV